MSLSLRCHVCREEFVVVEYYEDDPLCLRCHHEIQRYLAAQATQITVLEAENKERAEIIEMHREARKTMESEVERLRGNETRAFEKLIVLTADLAPFVALAKAVDMFVNRERVDRGTMRGLMVYSAGVETDEQAIAAARRAHINMENALAHPAVQRAMKETV